MNRDSEHRSRLSDRTAPSVPGGALHRSGLPERRKALNPPSDIAAPRGATLLESEDGVLRYAVKPVGERLFIQRTQRGRTGSLAVQCLLISGHDEFGRWYASEPTRFAYPLLLSRLQRCANDVFDLAG